MKEIRTEWDVILVDDEDYERVNRLSWYVRKHKEYMFIKWAERNVVVNGKHKTIAMHRFILGAAADGMEVDHKDGNGLNNQRSNLVICKRGGSKSLTRKSLMQKLVDEGKAKPDKKRRKYVRRNSTEDSPW
jgi:hypothetical protein